MPVVEPNSKVLVSGANGFIAVWVARTLLEKGYAVRGTVRSEAKGKHLYKIFEKYGDRFEVIVIENIAQVSICEQHFFCCLLTQFRALGRRLR